MARLRLLFALLLMAAGTTCGALAISGYYEPHMPHGQRTVGTEPVPASRMPPAFEAKRQVPLAQPLLLLVTRPTSAPAPSAKPVKTAAKPKVPAKERRPQQAAVQWPWSLFTN
jgi:hypothetical protein